MWLVRWFIVLLVFGLVVWFLEFKDPKTPEQVCSPVHTSVTEKTANVATTVGDLLHRLKDDATTWSYEQIEEAVKGAGWFWRIQWEAVKWGIKLGKVKADKAVTGTGWLPPAIDCSKICLTPGGGQPAPEVKPEGPPVDSFRGLSGEALGWAVARKYWPASEQAMAVEVMRRESGFRPGITGPTVGRGTMRGLFQINDGAHPEKLAGKDWRDPLVNGAIAYQIWLDAGRSWSPWSTAPAARRAAAVSQGAPRAPERALPQQPFPQPQAPAPADPKCSPGTPPRVRVGTWNILSTNDAAHVASGLQELAGRVDVIGGQEFNHDIDYVAARRALPGWKAIGRSTHTPIFIRPGLAVSASGDELGVAAAQVEGGGIPERRIVWATIRDYDGRPMSVVNTHLLWSVEKGGQMDGTEPHRVAAYTSHARRFAARMTALKARGPVVGTCDCNASPGNRVLAAVMAGFRSNWAVLGGRDTHGSRTIDYVWSTANPTAQTVLGKSGSDHSGVAVTFTPLAAATSPAVAPASFDRIGNPRTVEQAISWLTAAMPTGYGTYSVSNHCEGWMTRAYGHAGGFASATAHWQAAGERHPGMTQPPRGALVFWATSNSAGHVALSLGDGRVISTDYDGHGFKSGRIAAGPIGDLDKWGPRRGWRPPRFTNEGV